MSRTIKYMLLAKSDYLDYKKACIILYEMKKTGCLRSIAGLSFNIILEGVYRNSVVENPEYIETINYKNKIFNIARVLIKEESTTYCIPSTQLSVEVPSKFIKRMHIGDPIYTYYYLEDSSSKKIEKYYEAKVKNRPFFEAIVSFYCNLTREGFSVHENQFLKAILLKVLFNSKSSEELEPETVKLMQKAKKLLYLTFTKQENSDLAEISISGKDYNLIDAYFIHNTFVRAYNMLNNSNKNIIKYLFDQSIKNVDASEFLNKSFDNP